MDDNKLTFDKSYAKQLDDKELYKCLFDAWGVLNDKIQVWGRLETNAQGNWAGIKQAKLVQTGEPIEYPLPNSRELQSGVYLHPEAAKNLLKGKNSVFIKGELRLASMRLRQSTDNPFLLELMSSNVELLTELPKFNTEDVMQSELSTLISENIYRDFLTLLESKTAVDEEKARSKIEQVEIEFKSRQENLRHLTKEIEDSLTGLKNERGLLQKQLSELEIEQNVVKSNIEQEQLTLKAIIEKQQQIEDEMSKKIERLKRYVEEKAGFLKDFEFIDEDLYAELSGNKPVSDDFMTGLSFVNDFGSDYSQLTSYLQAYLKEQGQYYSRHIIENYLTLIRTNDLVILAGDSGSGKTSLVQSFAQAVGGVAKIIPVKPNWTSSEDLLGYYNPLERKYLATPFLEALLEANQNRDVPYFICLDEMNLARVEYYFADFLSKLEERKQQPEVQLYSDDEAAHVLSELRGVVSIISGAKEKYNKNGIVDFVALMQDEEVNAEMKRAFGFSDKDSLIKYHGDVRRMLAGVIGIPSTITIPNNVRIVGAINIDETTHYLSPKILDRAHIMKFKSPLLTDWDAIEQEIENYNLDDVSKPVRLSIDELGVRKTYPNFSPSDDFCRLFTNFNREHFHPLGVEFGMRTIRQGLNYLALFREVNPNDLLAINNFLLHKVLPKFTFDGSKPIDNTDKLTHIERVFLTQVEEQLSGLVVADEFSALEAIKEITEAAKANDDVVNYWA
ncbi:TPA: AAA family ATPase [Vibrio cholerae]|uniref:McrB family protein n=1 Tax=Vibrio cholerae TaxID=666 RepID=UPI000E649D06|nr:AAA family ATPase [Vibrio cholerae]EGR0490920.1 restriction endonuclease [Vibrio cholerae]EGR4182816.1 restriction endonuclease [Vibrio cholerae]EGR5486118.1 restriction endonuclease [Vibrio cholerae]ELP1739359.1 AAA family ATPase [Vibrio cholerae]MDV2364567.1 AAA family ATPase [Vibrio cholerae]